MVAAISIETSADEDEVLPGDLVGGRYRLGDMIGRGAMGEVYRAYDTLAGRDVAIKRFRLASDRVDDRLRFRREFHTLARLRHPRIVEAYDYGVDENDQPFYTMELLDGRDLGTMAPLPWRDACPLLRDVASALAFLHTRQLLHRDVAPRNVRCTSDGRAKLLDFGMLSTMGVNSEIVGTLPSIAPEMILGLPMDRRADLFGLGALAFWLLTGRHPQRVRNLEDLVRNGRKPPPPPSRLESSIPHEIDDLVLSLLSPEPLGRPDNATEVIERLASIAGLQAAPELDAARGYVRSAELVGRGREMDIVRKRLDRAVKGHGSSLLVEGRAGMGKTRLLREIELEAKLAGALVLRGEGDLGGPYALVRKLARELELGVRGGVVGNSGPHGALIDRLLHTRRQTKRSRKRLEQAPDGVDLREERLALQSGLSDFLSTFATHRPLVLLVDNLQRADEGSAAVLAALAHLAHERMLLLVGAVNPAEEERADGALANLRERAVVLRARGLDETGVRRLLRAMFGEAPNLATLARWMHRVGGGSPLHCTELARHLVDRGVIRFLDGIWVIPDQMPAEGLPLELEQAIDARIDGLSPRARALAQAIAVLGREAGLAMCVELSPGVDEVDVFAAIDELVREEIVIGSEERYRLRHDGLRDALLRGLAQGARAELELRVGKILAAAGAGRRSAEHEAQTGWHLLRGGERRRGAALLFRAGERLFAATSFEDCVAPLEAALEVWEAEGVEPRRCAQILYMLVAAGFYVDRSVNVRHSTRALARFAREANVDLARRLRFLGPTIAFAVAFVCGWLLSRLRLRRSFGPVEALEMYIRCAVYTAGVAGFSLDTATLKACVAAFGPLRSVHNLTMRNAGGFVDNLLALNLGRQSVVLRQSELNLRLIETARTGTTEDERAMSIGGARFQRGLVFVRNGSPEALAEIERLERLGPRIWAIGGLQLRTFWHMWRGESAQARRVWAGAELEFVRLGALWQMHAIQHSTACITSAFTGDVLGLKRSIEALGRQVDDGLCFHGHLLVARGEYQRICGDTDKALASIEDGLAAMPDGDGLARPWGLTARAQALLDAEDWDRAVLAADEAFAFSRHPERAQHAFAFRAGRIRALARAGRGQSEEAMQELEDLIDEAETTDNPFLAGMLHEARALVALQAGDDDAVHTHCDAVEHLFVPTRNPVLVARYEKLLRRCGLGPTPDTADTSDGDLATEVFDPDPMGDTVGHRLELLMSLLSQCETAIARGERALEALVDASGAQKGYLYLLRGEDFELVAPAEGAEPPPEVSSSLHDRLQAALATSDDFTTLALRKSRGWRTVLLHAERAGGQRIVVGAAVLFAHVDDPDAPSSPSPGGARLRLPSASVRDAIGQRLYDEGDVYTTVAGAD